MKEKIIVPVISEYNAGQESILRCFRKRFPSGDISIQSLPDPSSDSIKKLREILATVQSHSSSIIFITNIACVKEMEIIQKYSKQSSVEITPIVIRGDIETRFRKDELFLIIEQLRMHEWREDLEEDPCKRNIMRCIRLVSSEAHFCNCRRKAKEVASQIYAYILKKQKIPA